MKIKKKQLVHNQAQTNMQIIYLYTNKMPFVAAQMKSKCHNALCRCHAHRTHCEKGYKLI